MQVSIGIKERGKNAPVYDLYGGPKDDTIQSLLEFTKQALITTATEVLREEQANGFPLDPLVVVDNRRGKDIHLVKPLGKIEYLSKVSDIPKTLLELYQGILSRSKQVSGLYYSMNLVSYNGSIIADTYSDLEKWFEANGANIKNADKFRFINRTPYANRLELIGVSAGRSSPRTAVVEKKKSPKTVRKPNGTYYLSYLAIRKKYGKNFKIKYESLPGNYVGITTPLAPTGGRSFRATFHPKGKYNSGFYLYPSITVSIDERGVILQ